MKSQEHARPPGAGPGRLDPEVSRRRTLILLAFATAFGSVGLAAGGTAGAPVRELVREGGRARGRLGPEGEGMNLLGAIEDVQRRLGKVFRRWMEAGLVRDDLSVEHLAWELLVPVAYIRLLYLHGQATEEQRRASPGEEACRLLPFLRATPSGTANNRRVRGGRGSWKHRRRAFGSTLRIPPER